MKINYKPPTKNILVNVLFLVCFVLFVCILFINVQASNPRQFIGQSDSANLYKQKSKLSEHFNSDFTKILDDNFKQYDPDIATLMIMDVSTSELIYSNNIVNCKRVQNCEYTSNNLSTQPWEPGSIMKPLTMSIALDTKSIDKHFTYADYGYRSIGERYFVNAIPVKSASLTLSDILKYSLNTGATKLIESLGDGIINTKARNTFYSYLHNRFLFDNVGEENLSRSIGYIPSPIAGIKLNERYASMSFGVGFTATPAEIMAAYSALVNGGEYNQPHTDRSVCQSCSVRILEASTSKIMVELLSENTTVKETEGWYPSVKSGGKSGTASIAQDDGYYVRNVDSGSYIGFIGKPEPKYLIFVRFDNPKDQRFASNLAAKVWLEITNKLLGAPLP